jgi:hypothetical protein
MTRTPKRPRDTNQLAKMVVDIATEGESVESKASAKASKAFARRCTENRRT